MITSAAPSAGSATPNENVGGSVCASGACGCVRPASATATSVTSATAPSTSAVRAICGIARYNAASVTTPTAAASRCVGTGPATAGTRYAAYCAKPMYPDAITSGAQNMNCHTNKNAKKRPARRGSNASRRYA
ncbi:MAG TPA: hypothetical protein VGU66_19735 [Candidatus Elarobacter sp.]|nr:hypothetical protein [Candidatus Elarobacter sp.]